MEVEKNLEGKKKFEKPELQVVEMKLAGMTCASGCWVHPCTGGCHEDYDD